jgi:nicotinate-nucleotide pyrophosphorylase (carboxylating)
VRNLTELDHALTAGAESLLLDNMSPAETKKAVGIVRGQGLAIPLEASGTITLENIRKYALAGVGALTQSAVAVELSMRATTDIF